MNGSDPRYKNYLEILEKELIPAMGCTEPAAIAFACARAREELKDLPERLEVRVSGNIVKNVRSVIVPHTGGLRGIKAASALGVIAGISAKKLEAIAEVTFAQQEEVRRYLESTPIEVMMSESDRIFEIDISVWAGASSARVILSDSHTNITRIEKNGETVFESPVQEADIESGYGLLTVESAVDFAETVDIEDVSPIIERQIEYNTAISREGLANKWGANIGKVLLSGGRGADIQLRARAAAAAGSDARMSGCALPVIILSGSGNQGITASLPVI